MGRQVTQRSASGLDNSPLAVRPSISGMMKLGQACSEVGIGGHDYRD
jgi:hypothetical protein